MHMRAQTDHARQEVGRQVAADRKQEFVREEEQRSGLVSRAVGKSG